MGCNERALRLAGCRFLAADRADTASCLPVRAPGTTTAAASVQPPAGWLKYVGGGAEIYLPPYFDWDMKDPTTVSSIQLLGASGLEQLAQRGEPIVVVDSLEVTQGDGFSFMTASPAPVITDLSLEKYLEGYVDQLKAGAAKLASRSDLTINGQKATRLVVEGDSVSIVAFVVAAPAGYWTVNYLVPTSQLQAKLADVDASAATFRILP